MLTLRRWYTRLWLWYADHRGLSSWMKGSTLRNWR
jgi:hypothetical protein